MKLLAIPKGSLSYASILPIQIITRYDPQYETTETFFETIYFFPIILFGRRDKLLLSLSTCLHEMIHLRQSQLSE